MTTEQINPPASPVRGRGLKLRVLTPLLLGLLLLGACDRQLTAETLANERRSLQREITALRTEAEGLDAANEELRRQVAELMVLLETQQEELRGRLEGIESSAGNLQERTEDLAEEVQDAGEAATESQDVVNRALEEAAQEELNDIGQNAEERIEAVQEVHETEAP